MTDDDRAEVVALITDVLSNRPWGGGDVDAANAVVDALQDASWLP